MGNHCTLLYFAIYLKLLLKYYPFYRLEQIDQSIISMRTNLSNEQIEDFYVEGEVAKSQLNHLRDTELPLIQIKNK